MDNKHKVALENDQNVHLYRDNRSRFNRIRVVVYTMGAWPNSPISDNHVSVYLLVEGDGSVRINMATEFNDTKGFLQWSQHQYDLTGSAIHIQDYELGLNLEVAEFYRCIRDEWGLHRYQFSAGGSGCRYWV
jgi:hypothetical protein